MPTWDELVHEQQSQKIYLAELELARPDGTTKTLRLSTHGIEAQFAGAYFEPRLVGVPDFSRRIQEVFFGSTQIAYGNLIVLIGDGELDQDILSWNWAGRKITIKLGFDGLHTDNYRTIFTGRMKQPYWDRQKLTIPLVDYQADCLRKYISAGTYSDTLPNLVQLCLDAAGITNKDQAMWDAWAVENNFQAYLQTDGEAVSTALDRLLAGLACWWGFDREGKFQISTFKSPLDTDAPDLEFSDRLELLSYKVKQLDKLYWKTGVRYYSDFTTDSPTTATVFHQDSTIESLNPLALEGNAKETCLTSETDAQIILDRWWNLLSVQREIATVTVKVQPLSVSLDSVVRLNTRFGSKLYKTTSFKEFHTKNQVQLELFA